MTATTTSRHTAEPPAKPPGRRRRALAALGLAVSLTVAGGASPAAAEEPDTFTGNCVLEGHATVTGPFDAPTAVSVVAEGRCTGVLNQEVGVVTPVRVTASAEPQPLASGLPAVLADGRGTVRFEELGETMQVILHRYGPVVGVNEGHDGGWFLGVELPVPLPADVAECAVLVDPPGGDCTIPVLIVAQTLVTISG